MAAAPVPVIKVNSSALTDDQRGKLTSMRIDRQVGLVGRCTLRFRDFGGKVAAATGFNIGKTVTVASTDGTTVFSGMVTGVTYEVGGGVPELVLVADDAGRGLLVGNSAAAYLSTNYAKVVGTVVQGAGLTTGSMATDSVSQDYILQSGSPLDFVNEACARTGNMWWIDTAGKFNYNAFTTSNGSLTVYLFPDTSGTQTPALKTFSVKGTSLRPDAVSVTSWDPSQQKAVTQANSASSVSGESTLVGAAASRSSSTKSGKTLTVRESWPMTSAEATNLANSVYSEAQADAVVAKGSLDFTTSVDLTTKLTVSSGGVVAGSYLVTAVEHRYDSNGFVTSFTAGPVRPRSMVDALAGPREAGFVMNGLVVGVVSNVVDPNNLGRVKVKYATQGDTVESNWARVLSLGGGKSRGFEFQPEVQDEVLVAFEFGDTRRPVVLGGLFSSSNTLPTSPSAGNVDQDAKNIKYRRITTRLGHVIEMADGSQPADQYIKLMLSDGKTLIRLGSDKTDITLDSKTLTIGNSKATITLADSGDITIKGKNVEFDAEGKVTAKASTDLLLSGEKVSVDGDQTSLSGGKMTIKSDGPMTVQGATVAIN
jgi:uncharacterized protein involved in type VI secretion and phage assembly